MIKFLLRIGLIGGLAWLGQLYLPFWIAAVAPFVVRFVLSNRNRPRRRSFNRKKTPRAWSFWAGFIALFLLWGGLAFSLDLQNGSLLSSRLAQFLFKAEEGVFAGPYPLIVLTALVAGVMGGFSALTGNLLGEAVKS